MIERMMDACRTLAIMPLWLTAVSGWAYWVAWNWVTGGFR